MHRRELLQAAFALAVPSVVTTRSYVRSVAAQTQMLDVPQAFDYAWLKGRARSLASAEYQPPPTAVPELLRSPDWDRYNPEIWSVQPIHMHESLGVATC